MADDSIWKKEISFKRKPKEQADDATPAPDAEESTSLWNRELLPEVENAAEAEAAHDLADRHRRTLQLSLP